LLAEALVNVIVHLCKAGVEGSIPFVSTVWCLKTSAAAPNPHGFGVSCCVGLYRRGW
jgi:hypothetical protein